MNDVPDDFAPDDFAPVAAPPLDAPVPAQAPAPSTPASTFMPPELWTRNFLLASPAILAEATQRDPRRVIALFPDPASPAPAAVPVPVVPSVRPITRARVPDPPAFDGSTEKLNPFIDSLTNKITIDAHLFDSEASKVGFSFACLTPTAQDSLSVEFAFLRDPLVTPPSSVATFASFITLLKRRFDDPGREQKADRNLTSMKQGNRSFADFLVDWNRTLTDSGYRNDADQTRIRLLKSALGIELQTHFVGRNVPSTDYDAFVDFCKELDAQLQQLASLRRAASSRPGPRTSVPALVPSGNGKVASASTTTTTTAPDLTRTVSNGGDLMDLDAASREQQHDGKLTQRAKDARRALGRCLRCNQPGHIANACPLSQRLRAVRIDPSDPAAERLKE